jgi:hypothetical protein
MDNARMDSVGIRTTDFEALLSEEIQKDGTADYTNFADFNCLFFKMERNLMLFWGSMGIRRALNQDSPEILTKYGGGLG